MIRLIVFDIDNTLAPPNQAIEDRIAQQLRALESFGITVALASGKPASYMSGLARQLGLGSPVIIAENGAVIQTAHTFPPAREMRVLDPDEEKSLSAILESLRLKILKDYGSSVWLQPNLLNLTIFPATQAGPSLGELRACIETALAHENNRFLVYMHCDSIEVVPAKVSKGHALRKLRKAEGIRKDETVAVGDGQNDIPMLQEAGISIGIKLPAAQHSFETIRDAMDFIFGLSHAATASEPVPSFEPPIP